MAGGSGESDFLMSEIGKGGRHRGPRRDVVAAYDLDAVDDLVRCYAHYRNLMFDGGQQQGTVSFSRFSDNKPVHPLFKDPLVYRVSIIVALQIETSQHQARVMRDKLLFNPCKKLREPQIERGIDNNADGAGAAQAEVARVWRAGITQRGDDFRNARLCIVAYVVS